MESIEKVKLGVTGVLRGLEILQKIADKRGDTPSMLVILGMAVALRGITEGLEELEEEMQTKDTIEISSN